MTDNERQSSTVEETRIVRERQAARSKMMAIVLVGMAVLFFAITVVKIGLM